MYPWFWKSGILYFFLWAKHIMGHFAGSKRLRPPRKTPKKCPHYMFCPRQKNNFQDFQNQRCIGIFMSQRRRREKRDERRETRDERRETSERENKSAGDYISKLPGPKWKIHGLHRKERYSMYLTLPRRSWLHALPLNSKSPGKTGTLGKSAWF